MGNSSEKAETSVVASYKMSSAISLAGGGGLGRVERLDRLS